MPRVVTALLVPLAAACAAGASAGSAPLLPPTVGCDKIIDRTAFPYLGNGRPEHRYRQVRGAISVPAAYLEQVVRTHDRPWSYWRKQGLVVRGNAPAVTVSVPKRWRGRVAITWGNTGAVSSLRIARCGPAHVGNAYAGGFYLRSKSACLPLIFRVGRRSATVRFGVGRRC